MNQALSEEETKKKFIQFAKMMGCLPEFLQVYQRYERLYKSTPDPKERKQISIMANIEMHKLIGFRNPLVVDGVEILPGIEEDPEKIII